MSGTKSFDAGLLVNLNQDPHLRYFSIVQSEPLLRKNSQYENKELIKRISVACAYYSAT